MRPGQDDDVGLRRGAGRQLGDEPRLSDAGLADLLSTLRPRVAVISVGAHNDYDHPRPDTLAALHDRAGLTVYRTDENGRIVIESDGRSLIVRTDRPVR